MENCLSHLKKKTRKYKKESVYVKQLPEFVF